MRKNSKLLKNLLTTASALAVVLGSSTSALGFARSTTGPATLNDGAGLDQNAMAANVAFANLDTLLFNGAHAVTTNGFNQGILAIQGHAGGSLTVAAGDTPTIGSMVGAATEVTINAGSTLTLNGAANPGGQNDAAGGASGRFGAGLNDYTGLGDITMLAASVLAIDSDTTIPRNISAVGQGAQINVNAAKAVVFEGNIANDAAPISGFSMGLGSSVRIKGRLAVLSNAGNEIRIGGAGLLLDGAQILGAVEIEGPGGIISLVGSDSTITADIGLAGGISELNLNSGNSLSIHGGIKAGTVTFNNGNSSLAVEMFSGLEATTKVDFNSGGSVYLDANVVTPSFVFSKADTVKAAGKWTGDVDFGVGLASVLTIDQTERINRLKQIAQSKGAIIGGGGVAAVTALITAQDNYIAAIGSDLEEDELTAYNAASLSPDISALVAGATVFKNASQAVINAALNGTSLNGGVSNAAGSTLKVDSNFTVTGANAAGLGKAASIIIANQKSLTFQVGENVDVRANGTITFSGANSKLKFDVDTAVGQKTVTFYNDLVTGGGDKGILQFQSTINANALNVTSNGGTKTLGTNSANRLKELIISGDKPITFDDIKTYAKKITMTNTGTVTFKKKIDTGVDGSLNVVAAGRMQFGDGGLVASADRQFRVGAVHLHPAAALKIDDKAELIIAAPPRVPGLVLVRHTHKLILGNQVAFDGADSILTIESTDGHETSIDLNEHLDPGGVGKGILRLRAFGDDGAGNNSSLTLTKGSVGSKTLGTNPHNLKKLQIVGNQTVTLEHSLDVFTPTIGVAVGANFIAQNKSVLNSNITIGEADNSVFPAPAPAGAAFMTFDAANVAWSQFEADLAGLPAANPLKILSVAAFASGNEASNAFQEFLFEAAKVPMSVDLLNGKTIETSHANSVFKLSNNRSFASVQFVLNSNLDLSNVGVGVAGILELNNVGAPNNTFAELVLSSNGGAKTIGTAANTIPELRITGDRIVRITGAAGDNVDLRNVNLLKIAGGSKLIAETSTIGLTNVVIGEAGGGGAATFVIDAKNGDFDLLNGKTIDFDQADSILELQNTAVGAKTITLKGDLDPGVLSTGVVVLSASGGDNTTSLTIADNGGPHHIGAAPAPGNSIKELRITGDKPIVINAGAQFFADQLNVTGGAIFTTKEVSVAETPIIVVGTPGHLANVIAASAATATISNVTANLEAVKITHANSTINLEATTLANTVTLNNALGGSINVADPAADNLTDLAGIVKLSAVAVGPATLTIAGADATKSLGSAADKRLKSLDIAGDGSVIVNVNTYAKEITINSTNGDIQFNEIVDSGDGTLTFGAGSSDASVVKFAKDTTIASITSTDPANGTVAFTDDLRFTGDITDIKKINVADKTVTFTGLTNATDGMEISTGAATFNSAKVTFTDAGSATGNGGSVDFGGHAGNFTLTNGRVLDKADNGGILNLAGNGRVTGTIGATVAVGQINVAGAGSEARFENTVKAMQINGRAANQKFIFHRDVTVGNMLGLVLGNNSTIDVSTNDLTFKGNIGSGALGSKIELGQKTFTYEAGRARLLGAFTVNTEIHNAHADIGNIVVQGAGGNAGRLDLTGVTGVTINVSGGKIDLKDKKYTLVSKNADGIIDPVPAGTVITINDTGFAVLSPFWSFDRTTGELISPKNSPAIIVAETARQIDAPVSLDNLNEKGKEDLGKLRNQEEVNEAFISSLAESTSTQAVMEISQGVVENAISSVTSEISSRISSFVSAPTVLFNTPSFTPEVETGPIGGGIGGGTLAPAGVIETGVGVIGTGEVGGGNLGGGTGTGEVGGGNLGGGTGTGDAGGGNLGGGTGTGDAGGGNLGGGTGTGDAGGGNAGSGTGSGTGEGATEQGGTGSGTGGGNKKKAKSTSTSQIGVAAGDGSDGPRHGIWGAPFYGEAQQKVRNKTPGYKAKNGGATVGFDTMVNDNMMLGGALSIINTNIRHRDEKKGDRTKVNSYIWSLYAVHNLVHNFFAQGVLSVSYNEINNKTWKKWQINDPLAPVVPELATSNYSSSSIGGDFTLGKHIPIAQSVVLSPSAGLRYSRYTDAGYTETGPSDQNNTVQKKTFDKLEGIAALRLSSPMSINDVVLIPEVHGMVNYDFTNNKPKIVAKGVDSLSTLPSRASKSPRVSFNAGGGLTFKYKMMEYGATYDGSFSKKYIGHQGSLKIRVNF